MCRFATGDPPPAAIWRPPAPLGRRRAPAGLGAARSDGDLDRLHRRADHLGLLELELRRLGAVADKAELARAELAVALEDQPGDHVALLPLHPLDLERVHPHGVRRERAVGVVLG